MNINECKTALEHVLNTNPKQAVMLWGPPGVGKSESVRQVAAARGMKVVETRLSQMDPVDIRGIPTIEEAYSIPGEPGKKVTKWITPAEFPRAEDGPTIWFLDEINAGARATMASAMQLVLDRRSGDYVVPDNVVIWAAGNRTTDGAVANAMPSALSNRFLHFEIEPDLDAFIDHWLPAGFQLEILQFLRMRPELLYKLEKGKEVKGFPTSRSWEFVSKLDPMSITDPVLRCNLVAAAVGQGAMLEFEGFLEIFKSLPSLADILMNPSTAPLPTEPSAMFAVVTALVKKAADDTMESIITYFERMEREFCVMGLKTIAKVKPDLTKCAAFTRWEVANHNLMR